MSVTSGFFNSLNGDRKYNAEQMSAIFDGIINDGVFANVGKVFKVTANTGLTINVDVGRAWFNSAWIYNDAILPLTLDDSELILDRYDAVVIEVDHSLSVRKGDIKIIKGTPASTPAYPTMADTESKHQYPLAYIKRTSGSTSIVQADITNAVGTSACPYITAILQVTNIDNIVAQWEGQWEYWKHNWDKWDAQWANWFTDETTTADTELTKWMVESKTAFNEWFNGLQLILDGEVATQLTSSILDLQTRFHQLATDRSVYENLQDADGDVILDSYGGKIEGRTAMFVTDAVAAGVQTKDGTIISQNADYAEVGEWADGNTTGEDRIGYFVSVDEETHGITMVKANSKSDVHGVTVKAPAFSGNASKDKYDADGNLLPRYDYVAVMGFAEIIDNGLCEVNKRCMPGDDGTAVPSKNNMGYQVVERVSSDRILIAVEPGADMLNRIKTDMTSLGGGSGGSAYATDLYLYITGAHPYLSLYPDSDFDVWKWEKIKDKLARTISLSGDAQTITVYDGG